MDYFTILAQRRRLHETYSGRRLTNIRLFGQYIFLGFDAPHALKLACIPDMPYLSEPESRFIPMKHSRDWHAGVLRDTHLSSVEITPGDRILTFSFSGGTRLIFEMTGRHANIILVGGDDIIIGALRTVTGESSGVRQVRRGVMYQPPPSRPHIDPVWTPPQVLNKILAGASGPAADVLAESLYSGSRIFSREALALAEIAVSTPLDQMDSDRLLSVFRTAARLAGDIEKGGHGGAVLIGANGLPKDVFPLPLCSAAPEDRYFDDLNAAIEYYSREREHGLELYSLRRSITTALNREEKRLRRTREKVQRERGDDGEPERLERRGNIILAHIHRIMKGTTEATLPDIYEGGEITVELDPSLDAPSNAEQLFSRARKLRAAAGMADRRIADIDRRIEEIRSRYQLAETMDDIRGLRAMNASLSRRQSREQGGEIDQPFPRRFLSRAGLEIVVGRNDRENDELVRWANKNDTWLHAQGVGGSHVILRHGKQPPDHHSLEQAAAIAAHYSKAKTSGIVPVVHTLVKYVVKRKGQGPGQVTYTREKVIFAEPGLPDKQVI